LAHAPAAVAASDALFLASLSRETRSTFRRQLRSRPTMTRLWLICEVCPNRHDPCRFTVAGLAMRALHPSTFAPAQSQIWHLPTLHSESESLLHSRHENA